ncbi:MAG: M15 family metallopeptidase [Candidatus Pacebacteria bacterium]|nr:M15 family metallopeptidase [Candidatus Paceibacterota bacterium]
MQKLPPLVWGLFGVLLAALLGLGGYSYVQITELTTRLENLSVEFVATTNVLKDQIATTSLAFESAIATERQNIESKLGTVENRVGSISGTVGTLEKLSKTDPELLQKYSKVFFLNEHYAPERVSTIDTKYLYREQNPEVIQASVWPRLRSLLEAAEDDDIALYVSSAYRSFDEQKALKGAYSVTYGAGTANTFSADQGYSEHQLGTTLDFITTGLGGQLEGFDTTAAYKWLLKNAHKYGFTLSYPQGNKSYIFEPWHWRYVGVELATYLYTNDLHFYDLEQRKIDEYLVNIFD